MVLCAADAQIWQRAVIQGFRACDAIMRGLLRGSRWGGVIAVRVVPVCEVEVGSAWGRRSWRATFRATKRLAIAENIYKSQWESSLGSGHLPGRGSVCTVTQFWEGVPTYSEPWTPKSDTRDRTYLPTRSAGCRCRERPTYLSKPACKQTPYPGAGGVCPEPLPCVRTSEPRGHKKTGVGNTISGRDHDSNRIEALHFSQTRRPVHMKETSRP